MSEIVSAAIRRGIFDEGLYKKYSILTSRGIQRRYFEVVSRRKEVIVKKEYLLIEVTQKYKNVNISGENVDISSENVDISEQRKVKESKVKKSKEKESMQYAPDAEESPSAPPVITLPLNDKSEYPVTGAQVLEWSELYPAIDVEQQLRNMRGWLLSNPEKRKTKRGICTFITRWLSKEQDRGGTKIRGETRKEPVGTYDFEALEKQAFRRVSG